MNCIQNLTSWLRNVCKTTTQEYMVDKATKLKQGHDCLHAIRIALPPALERLLNNYQGHQTRDYNLCDIYNPLITLGTLTYDRCKTINDHIILTLKILEQLSFPRHLKTCLNSPELITSKQMEAGTCVIFGTNRCLSWFASWPLLIFSRFSPRLTASTKNLRPYRNRSGS